MNSPEKWQPIETAPRDGYSILVCNDTEVDSVYWDCDSWTMPYSGGSTLPYEPTHWMPVPLPYAEPNLNPYLDKVIDDLKNHGHIPS
jgi:hypothetical protein